MNRTLSLITAVGLLLGSGIAQASKPTTNQQYGSYVILGQAPNGENIALARTVIRPDLTCPVLIESGSKKPLSMITRDNPNHFSVIVCEALIDFDKEYQIQFHDKAVTLPVAKSNPTNIQVFGDTGCKLSKGDSPKTKKGGCYYSSPALPFKIMADKGAEKNPDLVLHMGDFNYRGTSGKTHFTQKDTNGKLTQEVQWPYDAGDGLSAPEHCGQKPSTPFYSQSASNSNRPDVWQNWHDDLFKPAGKLMLSAPWLVTRGNHELCSRAGPGYFYFLDPHSNLTPGDKQMSCPTPDVNKDAKENSLQIPSYKVSFNNLDVVVVDSANACDAFTNSPFEAVYKKVMKDVNKLAKDDTQPTWLVTHRPIWGIDSYESGTSTACTSKNQYACINQMMQAAIKSLPNSELPKPIDLILTGHMHKFESVSFPGSSRPPSLIVGSSGVALSNSAPYGAAQTTIDGQPAEVLSTSSKINYKGKTQPAYGYMTIKLNDKGGWKGKLHGVERNRALVKCSSKQNLAQGVCELDKNVSMVTRM